MPHTSPDAEALSEASLARVTAFLAQHGLAQEIVTFGQSTKTAQLAADAIGCELGQIAKSLVFIADGRPVVALVAGDRRGDGAAIAAELGASKAKMAGPDAVREATGYEVGGVSPFDLPAELPVLVDDSLTRYQLVYPAAGTSSSVVRLTLDQLLALSGGRMARISHS